MKYGKKASACLLNIEHYEEHSRLVHGLWWRACRRFNANAGMSLAFVLCLLLVKYFPATNCRKKRVCGGIQVPCNGKTDLYALVRNDIVYKVKPDAAKKHFLMFGNRTHQLLCFFIAVFVHPYAFIEYFIYTIMYIFT